MQAKGGSDFYLTEIRNKVPHMELRGPRSADLLENPQIPAEEEDALADDELKNGEAYAELVQCFDNKSLSLIM